MRLRSLVLTGLVVVSGAVATLEGGASRQPAAFEVVSIRPTKSEPLGSTSFVRDVVRVIGNRLQGMNVSASKLIREAYGAEFAEGDQVIGGDAWVHSERFDIDARAAGILSETPPSTLPSAAAQMLQQVLRERFQLRVRRDTRRLPRFALTYARADRSLKPGIRISDQDCTSKPSTAGCEFRPSPGKYVMRGVPIQVFVDMLSISPNMARRVVDDTGIKGTVDIDLEWPFSFADVMSSNASLFSAVQEQLGLKLEPRDVPLPVLLIESIQRPSEN